MHFFRNDVNFLYFLKILTSSFLTRVTIENRVSFIWEKDLSKGIKGKVNNEALKLRCIILELSISFESTNHIPIYGRAVSVARAFVSNEKRDRCEGERYWLVYPCLHQPQASRLKNIKEPKRYKKHFISVKKLMAFKNKKRTEN